MKAQEKLRRATASGMGGAELARISTSSLEANVPVTVLGDELSISSQIGHPVIPDDAIAGVTPPPPSTLRERFQRFIMQWMCCIVPVNN